MIGQTGVEEAFNRTFANTFNIHRTRGNFPNNGIDNFTQMAEHGLAIIDRVVLKQMGGKIDDVNNAWIIPNIGNQMMPANQ
jgi:hypothetical protein